MANIKKFDFFLIILFLTSSLVSFYFAYSMSVSRDSSANEKIGELSQVNTDVFIKGQNDFFYTKAQVGQDVLNRDQISTGLNSMAVIQLESDKGKIQLKELSHIIVQKSGSGFQLNIRSGEMEVESTADISVIDKEQTLTGEGTSRFTYKRDQRGSQVKSIVGNLVTKNNLGQAAAIAAKPQPIRLIAPEDGAIVVDENYKIKFEWSAGSAELAGYNLKVFDGTKLIVATESAVNFKELQMPYAGSFKWSVDAEKDNQRFESSLSSFALKEQDFFALLSPENGKKFEVTEGESGVVSFKWRQRESLDSSLKVEKFEGGQLTWLELTKNDFFGKKELEHAMTFPVGLYRWSLLAEDNLSVIQEFEIISKPVVVAKAPPPSPAVQPKKPTRIEVKAPPAPEPVPTPIAKVEVPVEEPAPPPPVENPPVAAVEPALPAVEVPEILLPAADSNLFAREGFAQVQLKLESKECFEYEIQIDSNRKFKRPTIVTLDKNTGVTKLPAKSYYVRARCWIDGEAGEWTPASKFTVQ